MINAKEFEEKFLTGDGEVNLPPHLCVDVGEDVVDHKAVYNSNVYKYDDQFFEVTWSRSNSGYWGDSESYPLEVFEVEPHEITVTKYLIKKEKAISAN